MDRLRSPGRHNPRTGQPSRRHRRPQRRLRVGTGLRCELAGPQCVAAPDVPIRPPRSAHITDADWANSLPEAAPTFRVLVQSGARVRIVDPWVISFTEIESRGDLRDRDV
jgi:hypothetical protein